MSQRTFPEKHWRGSVGIENLEFIKEMVLSDADFGVQIASNGQVWVCVNGIAFVRFKPTPKQNLLHQGDAEHSFEPVRGQTGCARCGFARGHHPFKAEE
jgi:hypothetical protein